MKVVFRKWPAGLLFGFLFLMLAAHPGYGGVAYQFHEADTDRVRGTLDFNATFVSATRPWSLIPSNAVITLSDVLAGSLSADFTWDFGHGFEQGGGDLDLEGDFGSDNGSELDFGIMASGGIRFPSGNIVVLEFDSGLNDTVAAVGPGGGITIYYGRWVLAPPARLVMAAPVAPLQFRFAVTNVAPDEFFVIERSDDLVSWNPIWTNTAAGSGNFTGLQGGGNSGFYRAHLLTSRELGITVDFWQDFEFDELTLENLDAHDHATGGSYSFVGEDLRLSLSSAAEQGALSRINGSTDSGTKGLRYDTSGQAIARIDYSLPENRDNVSIGFWFRYPAAFSGTFLEYDIAVMTSADDDHIYVKLDSDTETEDNIKLFIPSTYYGAVQVTPDTWYWITLKWVRNGNGLMRIYNAEGTEVGSEVRTTIGFDSPLRIMNFGIYAGDMPQINAAIDYDDWVMDWTNAVFPLGP